MHQSHCRIDFLVISLGMFEGRVIDVGRQGLYARVEGVFAGLDLS